MKREFARNFQTCVRQATTDMFPYLTERHDVEIPPSALLFGWKMRGDFTAFICLYPLVHLDCFMMSGGWSVDGEFPHNYAAVMIPVDFPQENIGRDMPIAGKFYFTLSVLWCGFEDCKWCFDSAGDIPVKVRDALEKVRTFVVPYFERACAEYGAGVAS